jgi:hypothetical protein
MSDRGFLDGLIVQPARSVVGFIRRAVAAISSAYRRVVKTTLAQVVGAVLVVVLALALWVGLLLFIPTYLSGELRVQFRGNDWTPEPSLVDMIEVFPVFVVLYVAFVGLLLGSGAALRQTSLSSRVRHVVKHLLIASGFVVFLSAIGAGILANDGWSNGDATWTQSVRQLGWETLDAIPVLRLSETFELSEPLPASALSLTSRLILFTFRIMVLFVAGAGVVKAWSSSLDSGEAPARSA